MSTNAPPLPTDLAIPVLVHALRRAMPRRLTDTPTVTTILNSLPRSDAPELSYTAIMLMPWIDTDLACRLGDRWLLNTLQHRLVRAPFRRPVQYTIPGALVGAAACDNVHVLDWWVENMGEIKWPFAAVLASACAYGSVSVIQWWLEHGEREDWGGELIRVASENGHVEILELFRLNGFDMRRADRPCWVADAVTNGHERVVSWWMRHVGGELGSEEAQNALVAAMILTKVSVRHQMLDTLLGPLQLHFTPDVASFACATGDLDFIESCLAKAHGGKAHPIAYAVASLMGHLNVLNWLHERAVPIRCVDGQASGDDFWWAWMALARQKGERTVNAFGYDFPDPMCLYFFAICAGDCRVLEWVYAHDSSHDEHSITPKAFELASRGGYVQVLEWLLVCCPELIESADLLDCLQAATELGSECVLEWWKSNAQSKDLLDDVARHVVLQDAVSAGHIGVLEWWRSSGLPIPFQASDIWQTYGCASVEAKKWWLDHAYLADLVSLISWSTKCGHLNVLQLLHDRDLIQPLLNGQAIKPLHIWRFPDGWDMFHWWMYNYGPECGARWRQDALSFPNALMTWELLKRGVGCGEIDGDQASQVGAVALLDWARQAGTPIRHSAPLLWATQSHHFHVLEWWRVHSAQLNPEVPTSLVVLTVCRGVDRLERWWKQSGLLQL